MKRGEVTRGRFEVHLLTKFLPDFVGLKDLARRLRDIIFGEGDLFVGTPEDPRSSTTQ